MRSLLFVPAANSKALAKSSSLTPDAFIFDLEDSAKNSEKDNARESLAAHLGNSSDLSAQVLVRVNAIDSEHFDSDVKMVSRVAKSGDVSGMVLPKVDNASQILVLEKHLEDLGVTNLSLWAMIETPLGVLNAEKIAAASPNLAGFILGLEDLSAKLEISLNKDRSNVSFAMQKVVMIAKAFDMQMIDSVCKNYKSTSALEAECDLALDLGFHGKSLIHPSQIETANEMFGVSNDTLEEAHKIIDAFEEAQAEGKSVASLNGEMVEELHFEAAKKLVLAHRNQA